MATAPKSSATNPRPAEAPTVVERDGKVLHSPRKRVLTARKQTWIACELREQGQTFELLGEEEVSVFGPDNPLGVFDVVSDTPAVWLQKAAPPAPVAPPKG